MVTFALIFTLQEINLSALLTHCYFFKFQLQKVKHECEDSIRMAHVQLNEEKSKVEMFRKRENEYLRDIDDLKDQRRR
jgi:hypothetical protein